MNDKKNTDPIVPTTQSDPTHKYYYCPHCNKIIIKGIVKRLSMTCQHCSELIDADEVDLVKTNSDNA